MSRVIRLVVQYDGTNLAGFQRQRGGAPTVQGYLEEAADATIGRVGGVVGAGRTDAGVHAVGQVAHLRTENPLPAARIPRALNSRLPAAVRVSEAEDAPPGFHARRDARSRTYCYHMLNRPMPSALLGRFALWVPGRLDVGRMQAAVAGLEGVHDFRSFGTAPRPGASTLRRLYGCRLDAQAIAGGRLLRLCIECDAFLYRMVRRIAGALLRIGRGRMGDDALRRALEGESDERLVAPAVDPCGLVLVHVHYGRPPAGWAGCGSILDTLSGVWLEWPRGRAEDPGRKDAVCDARQRLQDILRESG